MNTAGRHVNSSHGIIGSYFFKYGFCKSAEKHIDSKYRLLRRDVTTFYYASIEQLFTFYL